MAHSVQLRSFGAHDGSFHADEVTACSLLLLWNRIDRDKVYRTRDPNLLKSCDYVCDVGGIYDPKYRRFDHHQLDYKGPMSSAGMVLLFLVEEKEISRALYDHLNRSLILGVDAHDNGNVKLEVGTASFSLIISNFLPIAYDVEPEEMDKAFFEAVDFALGHLRRLVERFSYVLECQSKVKKAMQKGDYVLIFDEPIAWIENFFELGGEKHPAKFVISPSGKHWKLRTIPPSLADRMKTRLAFPKEWGGLRDEELAKVSGIEGAIFCHKGLFISIWKTKDDALKALHKVLEK